MANIEEDLLITLDAPNQLVPSLLHIGIQKIRTLRLENSGTRTFGPAKIQLLTPELSLHPVWLETGRIPPGGSETFTNIEFPLEFLDRIHLASLQHRDDGLPGTIEAVLENGRRLASLEICILPPNAWKYGRHLEALAAFVQKESKSVVETLDAVRPFLEELLNVRSFADAIELPLSQYPGRTEKIVEALYQALSKSHHIHYEREIRTYPVDWQKLRFHDRVLGEKVGTCIDLALLLAACFECAHLDPLLLFIQIDSSLMHALVGCWRDTNPEPTPRVIRERNRISSQMPAPLGSNQLILLDPIGLCAERQWDFSTASKEAVNRFNQAIGFIGAVNISQTRKASSDRPAISPMPFGNGSLLDREGWAVIRCAELAAREFSYDIVERNRPAS